MIVNLGGLICVILQWCKARRVLSPALFSFCVYIDGLLISLHRAGLGCHIGHMFVVRFLQLLNADDFLLAPPCYVLYVTVL